MNSTIYTVGHASRTTAEFIHLLKFYGIEKVVDIRKIARSAHNPQYNESTLEKSLSKGDISYLRMKGLGGLRKTTNNSGNKQWKNLSFRGYADYMQTPEFKESLNQLIKISGDKKTVIMCAETVPWRCHRSLVADALVARGSEVIEIISEKSSRQHMLTSFARVVGDTITYPQI